jgi:hypothetical protein
LIPGILGRRCPKIFDVGVAIEPNLELYRETCTHSVKTYVKAMLYGRRRGIEE